MFFLPLQELFVGQLKLREFQLALRDASEEQGGARRGGAARGRGRRSVFFCVCEEEVERARLRKTREGIRRRLALVPFHHSLYRAQSYL